jgi:type IV pilus assembly protein PilP
MAHLKTRVALCLVLALGSLGGTGCGEEEPQANADGTKPKADKPATEKKAGAATAKKGGSGKTGRVATLPPRAFRDSDFVESEQNRDPFRNLLVAVKDAKAPVTQRKVLMPNTPIASLRLIAIVTGIAQPRAMIVDEKGVGYVATRGDFVGQAEVVTSGGAENLPVSLNWRVDRIRENEVVLAREDPTGPNRPPLTRIIPLHAPDDGEQQLGMPSEDT